MDLVSDSTENEDKLWFDNMVITEYSRYKSWFNQVFAKVEQIIPTELDYKSNQERIIALLTYKVLADIKSTSFLCANDLEISACIIARSIVENTIRIKEIYSNPIAANQYIEYEPISQLSFVNFLKELNTLPERIDLSEEELQESRNSWRSKYKYHSSLDWAENDLRTSAQNLGLSRLYQNYKYFSTFVHSTIGIENNFDIDGKLNSKPYNNKLAGCSVYFSSIKCLVIITHYFSKTFDIVLTPYLENQIKDINSIVSLD